MFKGAIKICGIKASQVLRRFVKRCDGFGMYEMLGIAAVLIVAAFVIIPGFREFAESILGSLTQWWENTIHTKMFPTI